MKRTKETCDVQMKRDLQMKRSHIHCSAYFENFKTVCVDVHPIQLDR